MWGGGGGGDRVAGRPCCSVAQLDRVLTRCARGPGFESLSGHVLFSPLSHLVAQCGSVLGLRAAKGLSCRYRHSSEQIRGRLYLSRGELSQVNRVAW